MDNDHKKNESIKEIPAKSEVLNDDKYNVELAQDFSIPNVTSRIIDVNPPLTGFTGGVIVTEGEKKPENKYKNKI